MLQKYQKLTLSLVELVNRSRGRKAQTLDALASEQTRHTFVETFKTAHRLGLTAGTMSELSMRISGSKLLITPSRAWPESLGIADLVVAAIEHDWVDAQTEPPEFLGWHQAIYASSDSQAILFSQPAACVALCGLRIEMDLNQRTLFAAHSGGVVWAEPETDTIVDALKDHAVVLLHEHGMIARGGNLDEAVARSNTAERLCEIALQEALFNDLDRQQN